MASNNPRRFPPEELKARLAEMREGPRLSVDKLRDSLLADDSPRGRMTLEALDRELKRGAAPVSAPSPAPPALTLTRSVELLLATSRILAPEQPFPEVQLHGANVVSKGI
jgi:hypothetical protein